MTHWQKITPQLCCRLGFVTIHLAFLFSCCLPLWGEASERVRVYRCRADDGNLEYRQQACTQGRQESLEVDVSAVGWLPPKARQPAVSGKAKTKRVAESRKDSGPSDRKQRCWRVEKSLERLQGEMRRGYSAARGSKLRRQRREGEDYLRKFCRD